MSDIHLSLDRYIAALKRMRALIAGGLELEGYDDNRIGSKNNECSWGLCSQTKEAWPDPQDYLWPDQPDRIAPKYMYEKHVCPFRRAAPSINGCFWSCRYFRPKEPLTREQALALYDAKIKEAESWQS